MSAARLDEMNLAAQSEDRRTDPDRLDTMRERRDTRAWGSEGQCSPDRLVSQWREEVDTLRKRGATAQAVTLESCADEMETALREREDDLFNLTEAAQISGYSREHLGRLVREGKIRNAGRSSAPMIRRADLPKKATLPDEDSELKFSPTNKREIVRSVVARRPR